MNQENPNDTEQVSPQVDPKDRFIDLAIRFEQLKKEIKQISTELEQVSGILGEGEMLQDPNTFIVYQIIKPLGTFVEFKKYSYNRTKSPQEDFKATLAAKTAKEAGFHVP